MLRELFEIFFAEDVEKKNCVEALRVRGLPMDGNAWWTFYPKRAAAEIYKMQENTNAVLKYRGSRELIWEEVIRNNFGGTFVISIVTYAGYPFKAPKVFVINPKIEASEDKHMYPKDGSLCLFRPEVYESTMSVLEIRNLACSWCFCYAAYVNTGVWPGAVAPH